jgi:serine/threonine protein phosphatase PrpC
MSARRRRWLSPRPLETEQKNLDETTWNLPSIVAPDIPADRAPASASLNEDEMTMGPTRSTPAAYAGESRLLLTESTVGRQELTSRGASGVDLRDLETRADQLFFRVGTATKRGSRALNEDAWLAQPLLLGVADGVGGRPMGRAASKSALTAVVDALRVPGTTLVGAVEAANDIVWQEGGDDFQRRRASTLDVVELDRWGELSGVHVGDSRVLLVPASGGAVALTADQAEGNRLTQAIGGDERLVQPDVWVRSVVPGDRVIVATDGLWDRMPTRMVETLAEASKHLSPSDAATLLAETAVLYGSVDNVTVVVGEVTVTG